MSAKFLSRSRKLNPKNLFLAVLHLATSTNEDGFNQALQKTWQIQDLKIDNTPVKSSLSEARSKVSYEFFKDIYQENLQDFSKSRKMFRGFYIYAVDGDDLNLPCSKDILDEGYRGALYAKDFETHYPKMYTVYAYDVLNGLVTDFRFSKKCQEFNLALDIARMTEENSITIYDRLYCGYPLLATHLQQKNHCLIRVNINGSKIHKPIKRFLESGRNDHFVDWYPYQKEGKDGIKIRLVKIRNPRTKQDMVFATTLSREQFTRKEIQALYKKRWEIETSLRDLTHTLKMSQWHSKKENGVLQEIYALLWYVNNVKLQMSSLHSEENFLSHGKYRKSNFKLCAKLVIENIGLVLKGKFSELRRILIFWINRTLERRTRYTRSYNRVVKRKLSKFPVHSKVTRRRTP